jgi:hypothetical protein
MGYGTQGCSVRSILFIGIVLLYEVGQTGVPKKVSADNSDKFYSLSLIKDTGCNSASLNAPRRLLLWKKIEFEAYL